MSSEGGIRTFGPGAVLGDRYRLERRIATGGMATVWLAHDAQLEREVAIKILSDTLAESPAYTERFRREARVAAGLSHPNLVRVFDYSARSERPYIAMEHVGGGTLADRIAEGTADDIDSSRLARELLGALGTIHAAGVIHRDVKPSNVLMDRDGTARLTDFGIARPENATELTGTGQVLGTLKYMPPEVLAGNPATERSDLYACGVVLGECLGPAPRPELAALVDRLTADDPAKRPGSAAEALSLLDAPSGGSLPPTTPMDATAPRVVEVNGKRALAALAVLGLVGALVAVALASGSSDSSPATRDHTRKPEPRTVTTTSTAISTTASTVPTTPAPTPPPEPPKKPVKPEKPPKAAKPAPEQKLPPGQEKKAKKGG